VAQIQFDYEQPTQGPCSGDSGGPNLVDLGNGERVAGVISYGDQTCATYGVSGRASSAYDFITAFIGNAPQTTSASSSSAATTSSSSASTGVGGATSSSSTAGVGGAGPSSSSSSGNGFYAGDQEAEDYDGQVVTSGCSVSSATDEQNDSELAWGLLALLGLAMRHRRE
jgi:MYXO-CTERM domain-containing protein